eukprot:g2632.t1
MFDTPVSQRSTSETPKGSEKASYVGAKDTGKGDKISCKQDGDTLTSSSPPGRKKKSKATRINKGSQVLYSTLPRQYVGARSGIVTHVSCTVDSAQIAMSQDEDLQHSSDSYSCIECGLRFATLKSLQSHIKHKTIWTDRSLLGCRISVMWAHNRWYEGTVTQYDLVTGKHCVLYDDGEEKWYQMCSKTFYITSRDNALEESKVELELEEKSIYDEPLSDDYLIAQSLVHSAFGNSAQQVGYRTDGHMCITEQDKMMATESGSSLLYGEVLARGVNKMLDSLHLDAASCESLYDFGMGTGKLALQAWLQFRNLKKVVGVELALSRYVIGEQALLILVEAKPESFEVVSRIADSYIIIRDKNASERTLSFYRGDIFEFPNIENADIAILQTNFPEETHLKLSDFLMRLKTDCRLLTYLNLGTLYKGASHIFDQMEVNRSMKDRFPTSWSIHRGCHFFLWVKLGREFWEGYDGLTIIEDDEDGRDTIGCLPSFFRCFGNTTSRVHHRD